jgi:hypothetical protein
MDLDWIKILKIIKAIIELVLGGESKSAATLLQCMG